MKHYFETKEEAEKDAEKMGLKKVSTPIKLMMVRLYTWLAQIMRHL